MSYRGKLWSEENCENTKWAGPCFEQFCLNLVRDPRAASSLKAMAVVLIGQTTGVAFRLGYRVQESSNNGAPNAATTRLSGSRSGGSTLSRKSRGERKPAWR